MKIRYRLFVETTEIEKENFILNKVEEIFPEFKPFRSSSEKADSFEFYDSDISYDKILKVSEEFNSIVFTLREDKITDKWCPYNFCHLINGQRKDIEINFKSIPNQTS